MGLQIESGSGNGQSAKVTDDGRLAVAAIAASPEHYFNHSKGQAYTASFSATPTGAGDCFFYMKNTGEPDIIIEGFGLWLAANEYIDVNLRDTGTAANGTDITPVNLNTSSGNSPITTIQNGNDITGLSGGDLAYRVYHASSQDITYTNFEMDIILTKNGVFTLYVQTGTTALAGFIDFAVGDENA